MNSKDMTECGGWEDRNEKEQKRFKKEKRSLVGLQPADLSEQQPMQPHFRWTLRADELLQMNAVKSAVFTPKVELLWNLTFHFFMLSESEQNSFPSFLLTMWLSVSNQCGCEPFSPATPRSDRPWNIPLKYFKTCAHGEQKTEPTAASCYSAATFWWWHCITLMKQIKCVCAWMNTWF